MTAPKLKPLDRQVIVVTGASSGIGLLTARTAAAKGAKVLLVARDGEALAGIVREIVASGGTADHAVADVGDAAAVEAAAAQAVARYGGIDTWVNCAGVAIYASLLDTPDDEHERLFRTNYFGVVHGCRAAVPRLHRGGAIVTVASIAGQMGTPLMGAYGASKHAVIGYVETLRMELGEAGRPIAVALVKPSGIDTPIADHAANHAGGRARVPPPVYDPQLVADAILDCAQHERREVIVGGAGRAQTLFAAHFPPLFEKLAPKAAAAFVDPTDAQPGPDNLFAPARTGHVRSGHQAGRRISLYTAATRHRGASVLAVGAIAGGLTWLAARRRRQ
jgi:short-subunit dehydrogenase